MKKVWITALERDEARVSLMLKIVKQYGLDGNGHFWVDDLKNMAWLSIRDELLDVSNVMWIILTSGEGISKDVTRFGLSLLALSIQAKRGNAFPIALVETKGPVDIEALPTPLQGSNALSMNDPSIGAKLIAQASLPTAKVTLEYRLDIHAHPALGLWFEVGPGRGYTWSGALFGVEGGEIDSHGIGPSGSLPEKAVLEHPMKGLKLQLGDKKFIAWAVQNKLKDDTSYYVRIQKTPVTALFGSHAQEDDIEVNVLKLV
jgi:hypothetical protein